MRTSTNNARISNSVNLSNLSFAQTDTAPTHIYPFPFFPFRNKNFFSPAPPTMRTLFPTKTNIITRLQVSPVNWIRRAAPSPARGHPQDASHGVGGPERPQQRHHHLHLQAIPLYRLDLLRECGDASPEDLPHILQKKTK